MDARKRAYAGDPYSRAGGYGSPQRGPRDASVAGCPSRGRQCYELITWIWYHRGEKIAAEAAGRRSVELYSTILEHAIPTVQLFAHEGVEFLGRAADRADARFFQLLGDGGIGIHLDHFALNLVDDGARRTGRRHQPDPGRDVVKRRNAGFDRERPDLRQGRQRAAVELGKRA